MKVLKKLKKSSNQVGDERRAGDPSYKKQQSFHYSAHRSQTDRLYGRREYQESENDDRNQPRYANMVRFLPSIIAATAIILGLFYLLHVAPGITVRTADDKPFIGDESALQQRATEILRSSPLNRVKLTFDKTRLEEELEKSFPQYGDIQVRMYAFRQKPVVTVAIAEPTLLITNGPSNYILSEEGVVLADITRNKPSIDTTSLLLIQDQTGVPIEVGKVALTSDQVDYILQMKYQTEKAGLRVESASLMPGGGELHVRYGGLPYFVKYNLYEDARQSSGTFIAAKTDLERRGVGPKEYIDVRIPERAYVR